jgi:hypothetical protein
MKKTAFILLLMTSAFCLSAQTAADGYRFSKSNYEGSARTVAMGNAFTALGGDLGAVNINPASLAVARYSQITLSPGVNLVINKAHGSTLPGEQVPYTFEKYMSNSWAKFDMPNMGVSFNINTNRTRGIQNLAFGFVYNRTMNYQDNLIARGTNANTSFMGAMAAGASGVYWDQLHADDAWDHQNWRSVVGWKSGMISTFDNVNDQYIANSESYIKQGNEYIISQSGKLNQSYGRLVSGGKEDMVFNFGMNIDNQLYLGVNLGITALTYIYDDYFSESAVNTSDFPLDFGVDGVTEFKSMKYQYAYSAEGVGVFGKFGVIYTPKNTGFRLGAAIQTPTTLGIDEQWQCAGETKYTHSKFDASATSPTGEYTYVLNTPMRANFGAAYTLGGLGLISVDYEVCDYSGMRFIEERRKWESTFDATNESIKNTMGASHNFRAGLEVKPIAELALRAGYGICTTGERYINDTGRKIAPKAFDQNVGFGFGYSSKNSFFADFACQYKKFATEYIYPYETYIGDVPSPEIIGQKKMWNFILTIGARF